MASECAHIYARTHTQPHTLSCRYRRSESNLGVSSARSAGAVLVPTMPIPPHSVFQSLAATSTVCCQKITAKVPDCDLFH